LLEVEDMLTPFAGLGADAIALADYRSFRAALDRFPLLSRLATGPLVYSASLLTKTVPHHLVKPVVHVRVVNEGAPAIRLGQDGRPVGAAIEPGEVIYAGPVRLLAFSTIPYWGLGARIFPYAEERDDRFHLRLVNFGSVAAVANIRRIWQGTYRSDRLHDFLVDKVTIQCREPTPLQIGGDVVGIRQTVRAELSARPIRVVDYYSPPPV
jgi:hypothetical protein